MEHIVKQLKSTAKITRLSTTEKAAIKNILLQYVKTHPVESGVFPTHTIPSPFSIQNFRNKKTLSVFVIGGLLLGSSVSFAAENTVPGDALYPVKIHVNEQVRGMVAVTAKAKAEWEVSLVERRLKEVEKLASKQDVLPEIKKIAEENLEHYAERVKGRIAKFEDGENEEDALETASNITSVLSAHEQVLVDMETSMNTIVATTTTTLLGTPNVSDESIKDALKKVQDARGVAEKKHKELKRKYDEKGNEELQNNNRKTSDERTQTSARINDQDKGEDENDDNKNEEIRSKM